MAALSYPNRKKISAILWKAFPIGNAKEFDRKVWTWEVFGPILDLVSSKGFSWEIETFPDGICSAKLFAPPNDSNNLRLIVEDSAYNEIYARASCLAAAIEINEL